MYANIAHIRRDLSLNFNLFELQRKIRLRNQRKVNDMVSFRLLVFNVKDY